VAREGFCETTIADLNGDAWLDLPGPNYNDDRVAVLLNCGRRPGDVDVIDLVALLSAYGTCEGEPAYDPDADFDRNGRVELSDLCPLNEQHPGCPRWDGSSGLRGG
jgi:hypothetical protein